MDIVFVKPNKFENIMKYMDYISEDVILHINFQDLDAKTSQRVLDFVSGAAYIKDAIIVTPGESVFCVLPKSKEYIMDYRNNTSSLIDPRYDEEEEIRPNRR
ncbi:MAG: cell division protein SepF [Fusobacteriaceae bacterium]